MHMWAHAGDAGEFVDTKEDFELLLICISVFAENAWLFLHLILLNLKKTRDLCISGY